MARTIAEHQTKGTAARKTWHQMVAVTGEVSGRLQVMLAELAELEDELAQIPVPDPDRPSPSRTYTDVDPRAAKQAEVDGKKDAIEEVRAEAEEDLIDLTMQVKHSGAWIEWVNAHPAREGRQLDEAWECDMDALALASMNWVIKATDVPVTPEHTTWLHENVDHGDKHSAALRIVEMQYGGTSIPKSLTGSRRARPSSVG